MEDESELIRCHRESMAACDIHKLAVRNCDPIAAYAAARSAAALARRAADLAVEVEEPTRSIIHRSAASMSLEIGDLDGARMLVIRGLRGSPSYVLHHELLDVLDQADAMTRTKIVCVVAFVLRGDRVLVRVRRSPSTSLPNLDGAFECPGGKVESDECSEAALARELREEAGLEVRRSRLLEVFDDTRADVPQTAHTLFFRVWPESGEPATEFGKEPWQWRTRDEICARAPDMPNALMNWLGTNHALTWLTDLM